VVFSKVSHTATETSVALWARRDYIGARHHAGPGRPDEPTIANREAARTHIGIEWSRIPRACAGRVFQEKKRGRVSCELATSDSSASSTTRAPEGAAALANASPVASTPPALARRVTPSHVGLRHGPFLIRRDTGYVRLGGCTHSGGRRLAPTLVGLTTTFTGIAGGVGGTITDLSAT
jgi:hypothetical protein